MMHKNENRPGYKKTKVGWIPERWKDSRLKDCAAKIGSGITPKGGSETYLPEGIPLIRSQNVLDGEFSSDGLIYISEEQHRAMKGSVLQPNDVLFNITGASIGRCCLFPAYFGEANVNQHVCIVRLKNTCHPKLFVNILNSHIAKRQLHENQAGGGREGLNFQNLGGFRIPHPPLPEQEAIAEVLECWDKGIRTLENKIVKKRLIKKGLMQKLLSGQTRLPGFSKDWKNVKLGGLGKTISGGTPETEDSSYWNGGIPWCTPTEFAKLETRFIGKTNRTLSELGLKKSSATMLPSNSIIVCTRATVGACAINSVPMATNQGFKSLVPNNQTDSTFIYIHAHNIKKPLYPVFIWKHLSRTIQTRF